MKNRTKINLLVIALLVISVYAHLVIMFANAQDDVIVENAIENNESTPKDTLLLLNSDLTLINTLFVTNVDIDQSMNSISFDEADSNRVTLGGFKYLLKYSNTLADHNTESIDTLIMFNDSLIIKDKVLVSEHYELDGTLHFIDTFGNTFALNDVKFLINGAR